MFRFLFFSFLAGLFGWPRPVVYVHNEVTVDAEGSDGYDIDGDHCDYVTYDDSGGGGSDGGDA